MQVLKENILNDILSTAQDMFFNNGYAKTSMNEIASKVGISKGNLYRYFKNKEEIFERLTSSTYVKLERFSDYFECTSFDLYSNTELFYLQVSERILELIKDKYGVLLIFDCAQGTRYENVITNLIDNLAIKSNQALKGETPMLFSKIIFSNLVMGIVYVLRNSNSEEEIRNNIEWLARYHVNGVKTL